VLDRGFGVLGFWGFGEVWDEVTRLRRGASRLRGASSQKKKESEKQVESHEAIIMASLYLNGGC